jgi:antitoxin (DNA-binding transcriptional repressor) of toxin-antitoxin stability system
MIRVTATEAARQFSALLTRVEHEGEKFEVIRNGKTIAVIGPAPDYTNGAEVLALLRRRPVDPEWAADLRSLRELPAQERSWEE